MQIYQNEHQPRMKTKISENKFNIKTESENNSHDSLDTIQLTCDYSVTKTRVSQYYKAKRKEVTNTKLMQMESIIKALDYRDSETYLKRFERTKECLNIAIQDGDNLIQSRCSQSRLCQNCARAESAQRIEGTEQS